MYREIAKLIMYGDIDRDSILYQMGEIFRAFEYSKGTNETVSDSFAGEETGKRKLSKAELTRMVYTQIK